MIDSARLDRLMLDLGFSEINRGTGMVRVGIRCYDQGDRMVSKEIYPKIARVYNSTPQRVERNIRTAISGAFTRCDPETAREVFGYSISRNTGCPTNGAFIATMARYCRIED